MNPSLPGFLCETDALEYEPEAVLDRKGRKVNNRAETFWLVKWKGRPEEDASWESDECNFVTSFAAFE